MRRRDLVTGIGVIGTSLLAGCGANADSNDGGSNDGGSYEPTPQVVLDETVSVSEDEHRAWKWSIDREVSAELSMTVRNGPAVDVFLVTSDEYAQYKANRRFYTTDLELMDRVGGVTTSALSEGDYAAVIDNTDRGAAQPPTNLDDDIATVEIKLTGI